MEKSDSDSGILAIKPQLQFQSDAEDPTPTTIRKMKTFITCLLVAMFCVVSTDADAGQVFSVIAELLEEQEVRTAQNF